MLNRNKYKNSKSDGIKKGDYGFNYALFFMISIVSLVVIGFYSIGYMKYLRKIGQNGYNIQYREDDIKKVYNDRDNNKNGGSQIYNSNQIYNDTQNSTLDNDGVSIDVSANDIKIKDITIYKNIIVDLTTNERNEEVSKAPEYFIGLTREQLSKYYDNYMQNMPVDEVAKGLQTINILIFSSDEICVEKIYDKSSVRYYVVDKDGYIKVYYGDKKTLYENTGIETRNLPEDEKNNLEAGIWIVDEEELLSVLEGYSS